MGDTFPAMDAAHLDQMPEVSTGQLIEELHRRLEKFFFSTIYNILQLGTVIPFDRKSPGNSSH